MKMAMEQFVRLWVSKFWKNSAQMRARGFGWDSFGRGVMDTISLSLSRSRSRSSSLINQPTHLCWSRPMVGNDWSWTASRAELIMAAGIMIVSLVLLNAARIPLVVVFEKGA